MTDARKFLDDLTGRYARPYTTNIDEMVVAVAMGNWQAYDDSLDRLGDVVRETHGVAEVVGATLVLRAAARATSGDGHARLAASEFTSAEQECISNKVSKLLDEGMDRDQAVAVAISKCAPDKAKKAAARMSVETYAAHFARHGWLGVWLARHEMRWLVHFADTPTQTILPRVTFEEAVQDMVDRTPTTIRAAAERTAENIAKLYGKESGGIPKLAFVRSAEAAVTKRVQALMAEAMRQGIPDLDYMKDGTLQPGAGKQIVDAVEAIRGRTAAWSESYARMAFRTNVNTAVTAGRWKQGLDPDIDPILPAVQFLTARDKDVRKNHRAGHGKIMLRRNEAWNRLAPPLDYQCRCYVRDVSLAELRRMPGRIMANGKVREDVPPAAWHAGEDFRQGGRPDLGIG